MMNLKPRNGQVQLSKQICSLFILQVPYLFKTESHLRISEESSEAISVILMDGLEVTALHMKERKNKPILNIPNVVILKSSNRDIMPNEKTVFIYFKTRYDFESFYFSSIRASQLSQQKVRLLRFFILT
jgi:hypothetical protein